MKLFYRVFSRLSICVIIVLSLWAVCFYFAMMDELTDEVDDSLEDYTEMIIIRSLGGEELPSHDSGSNNQYYIKEVSPEYALGRPAIQYKDTMVYIVAKRETEPARVLTTIFKDARERYFQVEVSIPTIERKDLMESILYLILSLYAALLLTLLLINVFVFRRSMKPLYRLLEWLESNRLGTGTAGPQIETDTTEFRKLNQAVAAYARHSEEVYEQQKQFIGNASHEVQTPIAVCLGRIEMMMEDENLQENHIQELSKVHNTLEYVSKLNRSLLLLSKIDNRQFQEAEEVDFNSLLKESAEVFDEIYSYRGIRIGLDLSGRFTARMNSTLAGILVNNLLKNACVHNADRGTVTIRSNSEGITFSNTAKGEALDGNLIFERFYKGENKEGSTGLGLAIVNAICRHSNLKIEYSFNGGCHNFSIKR